MDYPPDAFDALLTAVTQGGGALLPDPCTKQDIRYEGAAYTPSLQERVTCGCGHLARMMTRYAPENDQAPTGSGFVTACAVCDSIGAWPKFCEAVYAVDPTLSPMHGESPE